MQVSWRGQIIIFMQHMTKNGRAILIRTSEWNVGLGGGGGGGHPIASIYG